jgi:hypothetical protein
MHPGVGIFVAVMALCLANCTGKYHDYCQSKIDCEGGNDKDVDACIDGLRGAENAADEYDCGDPYDDYWDCSDGKGVCDTNPGGNKRFSVKDESCTAKAASYIACVKAATGQKNGGFEGVGK